MAKEDLEALGYYNTKPNVVYDNNQRGQDGLVAGIRPTTKP